MRSGREGRSLREAENRYRGDRVPASTCDPREAQREFDREAAESAPPATGLRARLARLFDNTPPDGDAVSWFWDHQW